MWGLQKWKGGLFWTLLFEPDASQQSHDFRLRRHQDVKGELIKIRAIGVFFIHCDACSDNPTYHILIHQPKFAGGRKMNCKCDGKLALETLRQAFPGRVVVLKSAVSAF